MAGQCNSPALEGFMQHQPDEDRAVPAIDARLLTIIPSACVLGEGPVWDDRLGCLWFTDIQQAQLLRWDHAAGQLTHMALPERLGSLALTADPDVLLVALASGFARLRPAGGRLEWLHRVEPVYRGVRLNDGRVDRQGRFWAGSMVEDAALASPDAGALYRLDPPGDRQPERLRDGIAISNSIAFSPDGRHAYFADTPTRQILRLPANGRGEPTLFAQTAPDHWPDGSDVDAAGRLWNAEWGGSRITVYQPDGTVAGRLALPVSQPTCVAFGGAAFELLFVTSASEGLPAGQEPHAGDVLVYEGGFRGLPAGRFGQGGGARG
jgi:L-arabinonolactonase